MGPVTNVKSRATTLSATRRTLLGSKLLLFCLWTTSSRRGCCHLPGVEMAGEAALGELGMGVAVMVLVGVKLNLGSVNGMASLVWIAVAFAVDAMLLVDWTSAVEDIVDPVVFEVPVKSIGLLYRS